MAMFSFLKKRAASAAADRPARRRLPDGYRLYAIGDIHGELALAQRLVDMIETDNARRTDAQVHLVFLGDYVDRGPDSAGVIDWLVNNPPTFAHCHFLRGNHEDVFLSAMVDMDFDFAGWGKYGGRETLTSYGITDAQIAMGDQFLRASLRQKVPDSHQQFLQNLADCVRMGDFFFAHAGVKPGVALDMQDRQDLIWIRHEFLDSDADHGALVVHGHTISRDIDVHPNRIGIDTGGYLHGTLTAIGIEGTGHWSLQAEHGRQSTLASSPR